MIASRQDETGSVALRGPGLGPELERKRAALERILSGLGRTLVAYSGGVDSSVLLLVAARTLGQDALGVIARSPSLPETELQAALELAVSNGVTVRVIETRELEREEYRRNGSDRCFHCKTELFERLEALASLEGWDSIVYGALTDDLAEVRPGMVAAERHRVRAPLIESGIGKLEVRILARDMGLKVWNKPQAACLASRIPHGSEVTPSKLAQVERGEAWLRVSFGVGTVRLRHEGMRARIEVRGPDIPRLQADVDSISLKMKDLGFSSVEIDPAGYRRPDPQPGPIEGGSNAESR